MTYIEQLTPEAPPKRRSPLRRMGCILVLIVWFAVLLTPCLLLTLAIQGELRVATGGAPGQELRAWVIMEADTRGVGVSNGVVRSSDAQTVCVETTITYVLWAGQEDGHTYCECYQRASDDAPWSMSETTEGTCQR
ncbi:MAG: hypothetical protein IPK19_32330 [Chloroflexi bacterium]|nr:hypothetical protein [Chloroflexota bacterium]